MKRLLTIIFALFLSFTGLTCKRKVTDFRHCENEKAFISLDTYLEIQKRNTVDIPIYPTDELFPAINFNYFTTFSRVDSIRDFYCKKYSNIYGVIPLKYVFKTDTLFLPAFYFSCNWFVDRMSHLRCVTVMDSNIFFNMGNYKMDLKDEALKDSLVCDFRRSFDPCFKSHYFIRRKLLSESEFQQELEMRYKYYPFSFSITVQNDESIKQLKAPLDLILTTYLDALRSSLRECYKKDICELSPFELRIFSAKFFLLIGIEKAA